MKRFYDDIGLRVPDILLPREGTDYTRWAVIACDQYTSEPERWQKIDDTVGEAPSALRLIYPEVYLGEADKPARIRTIQQTMERYLETDVLVSRGPGFVAVERDTPHVSGRKGLVAALDLEAYDYRPDATTPVRATERTVEDRLPPRIEIRRGAPLETPHIMVLIDDPDRTVIEPLFDHRGAPLYDFELMDGCGHLRGYAVDDDARVEAVAAALRRLADPKRMTERYDAPGKRPLLYAMGDGNHSLATAKAVWEERKKEGAAADDPGRFALVEIMNLHDPGLAFEPIHRLVEGMGPLAVSEALSEHITAAGGRFSLEEKGSAAEMDAELRCVWENGEQAFGLLGQNTYYTASIGGTGYELTVAAVQAGLDENHSLSACDLDYIHGTAALEELAAAPDRCGVFLPTVEKGDLFKSIVHDGVLPRKTFSMGEAEEKRFYCECRRIR
jgi:hypothetical protein